MSDYLMQLQGQRNITFEAIESFYRNFISYETLYSSNVEAAFDGTTATKDLYDEEYKMYCKCIKLFRLFKKSTKIVIIIWIVYYIYVKRDFRI